MKECPHCHQDLGDDLKECKYCGHWFQEKVEEDQEENFSATTIKIILWILFAGFIINLLIVIY